MSGYIFALLFLFSNRRDGQKLDEETIIRILNVMDHYPRDLKTLIVSLYVKSRKDNEKLTAAFIALNL